MIERNEEHIQDDEISLIDLFAVLWHRKVMILVISFTAMLGVVAFSIVSLVLPTETSPLPNTYTPTALMLINNTTSSGNAMSAALGATGLGGLAGLAGVSTGPTFSELALYLMGTNTLLDAVVDEFDLITKYKIKKSPRAESRKALKKQLTAEYDEKSGVFSVSYTDTDPVFARAMVNFCVLFLEKRFAEIVVDKNKLEKENLETNIANTYKEIQNLEQEFHKLEYAVISGGRFGTIPAITLEQNRITMELETQKQVYTQLKVQYELLKVTMSSERPVFQILEMAEVPDQKSGPSRGMLCIIVTFAAGFFSVFLAFVLNAIANIRKDPEAMAKLRGHSRKA
ncbi:MAG: lipopolysaccharide biosynthesis protein [Treponema sp.]|jgi:uncharacterized protein involved in exopolysaccharide biosynthesis|nr:lipopolysaccharide biosynthesis protein [Treponema sp.]